VRRHLDGTRHPRKFTGFRNDGLVGVKREFEYGMVVPRMRLCMADSWSGLRAVVNCVPVLIRRGNSSGPSANLKLFLPKGRRTFRRAPASLAEALLLEMRSRWFLRDPGQNTFSQQVTTIEFVAYIDIQVLEVRTSERDTDYRAAGRRVDDSHYSSRLVANLNTQSRCHVEVAEDVDGHARRAGPGGIVAGLETIKSLGIPERSVGLNLK
jgi:hypothetical protein